MMHNNSDSMMGLWTLGIMAMLILAYYVANDANKLGKNGLIWGLLVLFMPMMGILVYVIVRSTWYKPVNTYYQNPRIGFQSRSSPPRMAGTPVYQTEYTRGTSPSQPEVKLVNSQFCTVCGSKNSREATYCNSCGQKLTRFGDN